MPKNDTTGNSFETTGSRSSRSGGPKRQASTSTSSRGAVDFSSRTAKPTLKRYGPLPVSGLFRDL